MSSSRQTVLVYLVIGLIIGFGIGFFTPGLIQPGEVNLVPSIQARGTLIVGTEAGYPPFEMYNTTTAEYYGFDIDIAQLIADELGVDLVIQDMPFDSLIAACKAGNVDMLAAAMDLSAERARELAFSDPYLQTNQVMVVNGSSTLEIDELADLAGYEVGAQTGTVQAADIQAAIDAGAAIVLSTYASVAQMFIDLDSGGLDAVFVDEPVYEVYAELYTLRTIYTVRAAPMVLYCRYENPDLLAVINDVLGDAFADGTMANLVDTWFGG
ncbi:MAG: amino acid ABC transporter substrate-binding protein [Candidatus Thorarchaeota archaeon]|nr:MAG: amino acid ABC transporter substrate-binding protein [Candidatus Thorarchaeota archaeon]